MRPVALLCTVVAVVAVHVASYPDRGRCTSVSVYHINGEFAISADTSVPIEIDENFSLVDGDSVTILRNDEACDVEHITVYRDSRVVLSKSYADR